MKERSDATLGAALRGVRVVSLAVNVPGPVAAARLQRLGADVVKIEPPAGDPLRRASPTWYDELVRGQEVLKLDLKQPEGKARLAERLDAAELLLTSTRPAALERLGLGWSSLSARHPRLSLLSIVGYPAPKEERPGHDLTFQAALGLLTPPELPRTLLADLATAERVVSTALALLLARARGAPAAAERVVMLEAAAELAAPLRHRLTTSGAALGGGTPLYRIYRAGGGWVAVALLEPHFRRSFEEALQVDAGNAAALERVFLTRSADEWEQWAAAHGLPIAAVAG